MIDATCTECGAFFRRELDEDWKTRCLRCWAQNKKEKRETTWPSVPQTSRRVRELEADAAEWRAEANRLSCEIADLRELIDIALDPAFLRKIIQCVHPDKNSSPLAAAVTADLLALRDFAKETRH